MGVIKKLYEYIVHVIVLGIILGIVIDHLLFRIWHHIAHSDHLREKEKFRKRQELSGKLIKRQD